LPAIWKRAATDNTLRGDSVTDQTFLQAGDGTFTDDSASGRTAIQFVVAVKRPFRPKAGRFTSLPFIDVMFASAALAIKYYGHRMISRGGTMVRTADLAMLYEPSLRPTAAGAAKRHIVQPQHPPLRWPAARRWVAGGLGNRGSTRD
jgi:hypothetical protein